MWYKEKEKEKPTLFEEFERQFWVLCNIAWTQYTLPVFVESQIETKIGKVTEQSSKQTRRK